MIQRDLSQILAKMIESSVSTKYEVYMETTDLINVTCIDDYR